MVMGSVSWMEGVGLGLARNIVQRFALETGNEQRKPRVRQSGSAPDIMPRPTWPVLVPWSSLPAVPFRAKTGTVRPPRSAARMAVLASDAHANSPLAVKRFPKSVLDRRGTQLEKPSSSELSFWAAPADNPITLLAAACKNYFDSCSSLTARERTIAPTIVERIAIQDGARSDAFGRLDQARRPGRRKFLLSHNSDSRNHSNSPA
jgi:hypothetical protein